jgi:phage shock protein B
MNFYTFLFVPMIVFLTFVAPVWIVMHYRSVNRSSQSLSEDERGTIDSMLATIDKLQDRIHALEALLDADQPDWRGQQPHTPTKQAGE